MTETLEDRAIKLTARPIKAGVYLRQSLDRTGVGVGATSSKRSLVGGVGAGAPHGRRDGFENVRCTREARVVVGQHVARRGLSPVTFAPHRPSAAQIPRAHLRSLNRLQT
jgi:hypothetical protein